MPQLSPSVSSPSSAEGSAQALARIEIVLCQTSMAENIGAAARAMKTMGLSRLVLVAPRVSRAAIDDKARAVATHAADLLDAARVVDSVDEAVADSVAVWATTARTRSLALPLLDGRAAAAEVMRQVGSLPAESTGRISILFGAERTGLTNEELGVADHLLALHANPDYPVLNLAQAVQLVAYELFHASRQPQPLEAGGEPPARKAELATLCARLEAALAARDYFPGSGAAETEQHARRLMQRLRVMLNRAEPRRDELQILQGMLTALSRGRRDGAD
ncbi:RNA methyltransferase [Guyparkeria halophila]|uniref:tRNA (cytidine/uridine-2'-O-)-methyltransferase TrmJ n=1 Tax=Guyparkeria halophila TaxID=47960 RepID=A0ABZ0YZ59_9GAMM|nr:RNA methyltransferase [Guyparkeria halophila]WQH16562.1 RNA methyltransferase [Guyparkeria halophila]